jgi:hypothetical protein
LFVSFVLSLAFFCLSWVFVCFCRDQRSHTLFLFVSHTLARARRVSLHRTKPFALPEDNTADAASLWLLLITYFTGLITNLTGDVVSSSASSGTNGAHVTAWLTVLFVAHGLFTVVMVMRVVSTRSWSWVQKLVDKLFCGRCGDLGARFSKGESVRMESLGAPLLVADRSSSRGSGSVAVAGVL